MKNVTMAPKVTQKKTPATCKGEHEIELYKVHIAIKNQQIYVPCDNCGKRCPIWNLLPPNEWLHLLKTKQEQTWTFSPMKHKLTLKADLNYDEIKQKTTEFFKSHKNEIPPENISDSFEKFVDRALNYIITGVCKDY